MACRNVENDVFVWPVCPDSILVSKYIRGPLELLHEPRLCEIVRRFRSIGTIVDRESVIFIGRKIVDETLKVCRTASIGTSWKDSYRTMPYGMRTG